MFDYCNVSPHIFFSDDRETHTIVCILGSRHARLCRVTAIQLLCGRHEHEHFYCIQYTCSEHINWPHKVQYSHVCWKYNLEQLWLDETNECRHQPHVVFVRVPWWVMSRANYVCLRLPTCVFAFGYNIHTPEQQVECEPHKRYALSDGKWNNCRREYLVYVDGLAGKGKNMEQSAAGLTLTTNIHFPVGWNE